MSVRNWLIKIFNLAPPIQYPVCGHFSLPCNRYVKVEWEQYVIEFDGAHLFSINTFHGKTELYESASGKFILYYPEGVSYQAKEFTATAFKHEISNWPFPKWLKPKVCKMSYRLSEHQPTIVRI